jgi:hypothetical protein
MRLKNFYNLLWVVVVLMLLSVNPSYSQYDGPSENLNDTTEVNLKTEVREWDESRAPKGYTLFAFADTTYLIDMEGIVVKKWVAGACPSLLDYNGNLLTANTTDAGLFTGFVEYDWDGNEVWRYTDTRDFVLHHDFLRIYNKKLHAYTTLYIVGFPFLEEDAIAEGANPDNGPYRRIRIDGITEIDMQGNIIWEWCFFDHLIQDYDPEKPNYTGEKQSIKNYPGRLDINMKDMPINGDWLHCNSLDYNPDLDQILINSVYGEFYIIDHGATFIPNDPDSSIALAASPAGDFLYRFGHPYRYEQGDPRSFLSDRFWAVSVHRQLGGNHDAQWIKPGCPGEGNLLVFNNGGMLYEYIRQSYIFEINPYLNFWLSNTGSYVNPPDAGYKYWVLPKDEGYNLTKLESNQIVWRYYSRNKFTFFSQNQSGASRLPNGNTLICASNSGHFFEVTPDGDKVWDYINPITLEGIVEEIPPNAYLANNVFKALRYYPDDPQLAGRTLIPKTTITTRIPNYTIPLNPTGVIETENGIPEKFELAQNYPNPFNPETRIEYRVLNAGNVLVKVYNLLGQEVKTLVNDFVPAGTYFVTWNGTNNLGRKVASGVYLYTLVSGKNVITKKMLLIR